MQIYNVYKSEIDETIKFQFRTAEKHIIEACVIFFEEEPAPVNICISSQIGCSCKCTFCATGAKAFIRNLTFAEIIEQVSLIFSYMPNIKNKQFEITYMGTGEPFNNIHEVLKSLRYFEEKYNGLQRINMSTIIPHLNVPQDEFIVTKLPIHFQYSLHFLTDDLRNIYFNNKLVPVREALEFLNVISEDTREEFCVNYLLFDGINDSTRDAMKLVQLIKPLNAYIKISKYCPIADSGLKPSNNFEQFTAVLDEQNIRWKPFQSKGTDIKASCGHLLSDIDF